MTSLERVLAVFAGKQPDTMPILPIIGQAAACLNGMAMGARSFMPVTHSAAGLVAVLDGSVTATSSGY